MGSSEAGNKPALNTTDFVIYEIPSDGVTLQYPKNWEITKDSGLTIVSPKENDYDTFIEAVLLNVIPSPNKSLSQLSHEVTNFYNETLSDFELIHSNPNATLAGNEAHRLEYKYSDPKYGEIRAVDIGMIKNDKIYVVQYILQENKSELYLPIIQKMIDSISIHN